MPRGISKAVHANAGRGFLRVLRQMQDLDRQHREHAGHQIEDDARDQCEQCRLKEADPLPRDRCRRRIEGKSMPRRFATDIFLDHQHAIKTLRKALRYLPALDGKPPPLARRDKRLRRRIDDQRVVIGKEGDRADIVALEVGIRQRQREGLRIGGEGCRPWRRLRQPAARCIEDRAVGARQRAARCRDRQRERYILLAGDAFLLADEESHLRVQGDRIARFQMGRRSDPREQNGITLVAEAGDRAEPDQRRCRPFQPGGDKALGQLPVDGRRLAGIPRIAPIGVPMFLHGQADADLERLARRDRRRLAQKLDLNEVGGVLRPRLRKRQGQQDRASGRDANER
jgi:hypothetical protein